MEAKHCQALDYHLLESYQDVGGVKEDKITLVETNDNKRYELHISFKNFTEISNFRSRIRLLKLDIFLPGVEPLKKNTFSLFTQAVKMNDYVVIIESDEMIYYCLIELKSKNKEDADLQLTNGFYLCSFIHETLCQKNQLYKKAFFTGFIFKTHPNPFNQKMAQTNPDKSYIHQPVNEYNLIRDLNICIFDRSTVFFPFKAIWDKIEI